MTPLDCAKGIADFLKSRMEAYDESYTYTVDGKETRKPIDIYTGFLPRAQTRQQMQALCPAIVLRPDAVEDGKERTELSLVAYVTVYDEDLKAGSDSLYHMLEFVRFSPFPRTPLRGSTRSRTACGRRYPTTSRSPSESASSSSLPMSRSPSGCPRP